MLKTKIGLALMAMVFLIAFASTAMATITVADINVTCDPVNNNNGACAKYSVMQVDFRVTDNNGAVVTGTTADANIYNWNLALSYGSGGNCKDSGTIAYTPNDANIAKTIICAAHNGDGTDINFGGEGRNCTIYVTPTNLGNGTYCFDLNVRSHMAQITNPVDGNFTGDKNGSVSFTINNAITNSSTIALALLLVLVLFTAGLMYAFKTDAIQVEQLLMLIIAGVIMAALILVFYG